MSNTYPVTYWVGGAVKYTDAIKMVNICHATVEEIELDKYLSFSEYEVAFGEIKKLEEFLQENKIQFIKRIEAENCDAECITSFDGENAVNDPGYEGWPAITFNELKKLFDAGPLNLYRAVGKMIKRLDFLPQLELTDYDDDDGEPDPRVALQTYLDNKSL
jgi:hypothetical protein